MQTEEPTVLVADDARHAACLYQMEPPLTPGDVTYNIDQLAGSGFDTILYGAGLEGGVVTYASKVAPLWGDNVDKWTHPVWYRAARNLRQLIADGHDPLALMIERAHEKGIWLLASNWVNFEGTRRQVSGGLGRTCNWVYEHAEYEAGPEDDPRAGTLQPMRFSFLHEEVRRTRFVLFEELLTRYETDGIDLDLINFSPFCRIDQVDQLAPLMTQWLSDLRRVADSAEQAQNRRKRIYVRLGSRPDSWPLFGYDVPTWVSQKLVDGLICVAGGVHSGVNHAQDVSDAVKLTRGSGCRVVAGMSCVLQGQLHAYGTPPMLWAAAANAHAQGANGFGIVDAFFGPNGWPWRGDEYNTTRLLGQPDLLATADKHYHAPNRSSRPLPQLDGGGCPRLPRTLAESEPVRTTLWVGDDLDRWQGAGRVESVRLCVRISGIEASLNKVRVEMNGRALPAELLDLNDLGYRLYHHGHIGPYGYIYEFDLTSAHFPYRGANDITVTLVRRDPHIATPFELCDVDLTVRYRLHRHFRRTPLEY